MLCCCCWQPTPPHDSPKSRLLPNPPSNADADFYLIVVSPIERQPPKAALPPSLYFFSAQFAAHLPHQTWRRKIDAASPPAIVIVVPPPPSLPHIVSRTARWPRQRQCHPSPPPLPVNLDDGGRGAWRQQQLRGMTTTPSITLHYNLRN